MPSSTAVKIDGVEIGVHVAPAIVAEMSGNHNRSLERAIRIVEAAAAAGVRMLKLQTYTADSITLDIEEGEFVISDPKSLWKNRSLYSLYEEAHTPREWHEPIMRRARELGLVCFSSVFDPTAVEFLEKLGVSAYKIASQECVDLPLIRTAASTRKPIVISTGMATLSEIDEAVNAARQAGASDLVLMKCTSTYPASPADSNVLTVPAMRKIFGCEVGLSDHTPGIGVAVAAVAHGATLVEKHFTLSRADGGVDSGFSLDAEEMGALVKETERAWRSLGRVFFGATDSERPSMSGRRSLYVVRDIEAGGRITEENVRSIRPSNGLPPKHFDAVRGRRTKRPLRKGTALTWDVLE